jgi:hypothetical protein
LEADMIDRAISRPLNQPIMAKDPRILRSSRRTVRNTVRSPIHTKTLPTGH